MYNFFIKPIHLLNIKNHHKCPCCKTIKTLKFIEKYELEQSSSTSITNKKTKFTHLPYYCDNCGHIWNTTPPTEAQLKDYYQDQLMHVAEDYDVKKRVGFINETLGPLEGIRLLDFGSNSSSFFHKTLVDNGVLTKTYDVSDSDNIDGIFDVITCYFVLEHIVNLEKVISLFRSLSHKNTILIIEVPAAEIYADYFEVVCCEHQQHFQQKSLEVLMAFHGFHQLKSDFKKCSRNYGFVASFGYTGTKIPLNNKTHTDTRQNYLAARNAQINYNENYPFNFCEKNSIDQFSNIIIWGVNAYFDDLMIAKVLKDCRIIALDINDKKSKNLGHEIEFYIPEIFFDNLSNLMLDNLQNIDKTCVVITACLHTKSILPRLKMFKNIFIYNPINA
jgi:hypothetical protein